MDWFYLLVVLAGGEQGFECGAEAYDVKKATRHQTLENHHHGILRERRGEQSRKKSCPQYDRTKGVKWKRQKSTAH